MPEPTPESPMKSFKLSTDIIEAMVDAKLDPTEFFTFMSKYGEFIKYGLTFKKMDAISRPEFDTVSVMQALSTGVNCFESFLADFHKEYEHKSINK